MRSKLITIKVTGDVSLPVTRHLTRRGSVGFLGLDRAFKDYFLCDSANKNTIHVNKICAGFGSRGHEQSAIERLIVVLSTYGRATRRAGAE